MHIDYQMDHRWRGDRRRFFHVLMNVDISQILFATLIYINESGKACSDEVRKKRTKMKTKFKSFATLIYCIGEFLLNC